MSYSDAMIEELKATQVWDYDSATAFATKYMQKPRSVVAKIGALGLTYKAKSKLADTHATKPKVAKRTKADVAKAIQAAMGLSLPTLEKMNADDLASLEAWLGEKD